MRIAPQKEVMIGISNFNLIKTGQLVSFLEVGDTTLDSSTCQSQSHGQCLGQLCAGTR